MTETLEMIKYLDSLNQDRINFIIKGSFVNFSEKKIRRWIRLKKIKTIAIQISKVNFLYFSK